LPLFYWIRRFRKESAVVHVLVVNLLAMHVFADDDANPRSPQQGSEFQTIMTLFQGLR
jgi:hypothetical protein